MGTVRSSTRKGKILMVVISKPVSLSPTSIQITHRCKKCIIWDTKLPLIPSLITTMRNSGQKLLLMTGPRKWLALDLSLISLQISLITLWPYTMYFRMPHRCHGDLQNCPTRSHAVWEMVMNELDRREDS